MGNCVRTQDSLQRKQPAGKGRPCSQGLMQDFKNSGGGGGGLEPISGKGGGVQHGN